jgi:hypothetical protein
MATDDKALDDLLARLFQAHPWHGITPCADGPATAHPKRASRSCGGCLLNKGLPSRRYLSRGNKKQIKGILIIITMLTIAAHE